MEDNEMEPIALKVGPLHDRTPVKLSIVCEPELHGDLTTYAAIHAQTYGKSVTVAQLIPSMLKTLIESDSGFKRARRHLDKGN